MNPDMRISMPRTQSQQCQEELAGTLSLGAKSLWFQQWRACVGLDVCIFASDSLPHPFGNRGSNWGICQHSDEKAVINSFWRKLSFLIALQIQCNGPFFFC